MTGGTMDCYQLNSGPFAARSPTVPRQIHRNRASYSCHSCRRRKVKCDQVHPTCANCAKHNETCTYNDNSSVKSKKDAKAKKSAASTSTSTSEPYKKEHRRIKSEDTSSSYSYQTFDSSSSYQLPPPTSTPYSSAPSYSYSDYPPTASTSYPTASVYPTSSYPYSYDDMSSPYPATSDWLTPSTTSTASASPHMLATPSPTPSYGVPISDSSYSIPEYNYTSDHIYPAKYAL